MESELKTYLAAFSNSSISELENSLLSIVKDEEIPSHERVLRLFALVSSWPDTLEGHVQSIFTCLVSVTPYLNRFGKLYVAKIICKLSSGAITDDIIDTCFNLYNMILETKYDLIAHSVAESIQIFLSNRSMIIHKICELCRLHEKFHIILLKHIVETHTDLLDIFPPSFLEESARLCEDALIQRKSSTILKILEVYPKLAKSIPADKLFDVRNRFRNQLCSKVFEIVSSQNTYDLNADRIAYHMALKGNFAVHDNLHHMYCHESRMNALVFQAKRLIDDDLFFSCLSGLWDADAEYSRCVENCLIPILKEYLTDRHVELMIDFLDCRSSYRSSLILLSINSPEKFILNQSDLLNVILCSGFEDLKNLSLQKLSEQNADLDSLIACQKNCPNVTWKYLLDYHIGHQDPRDFFYALLADNASSVSVVLPVLEAIIHLLENTNFDLNISHVIFLDVMDRFFDLCNSITPECYEVEEDEVNTVARSEWRVISACANILSHEYHKIDSSQKCEVLEKVVFVMGSLKHRGAFSSLYLPVLFMMNALHKSPHVSFNMVLEMLKSNLYKDEAVDLCTRRSAGLPLIFKAFMHSVFPEKNDCLNTIFHFILESSNHCNLYVRIRSINILCEILNDRTLAESFESFNIEAFKVAFHFLKSDIWGERNVGLRLFSSVFKRAIMLNCRNNGKVDANRIPEIISVLMVLMSNTHEQHIYPILLCLDKIDMLFPSLHSTFRSDVTSFLKRLELTKFYYHHMASSIKATLQLDDLEIVSKTDFFAKVQAFHVDDPISVLRNQVSMLDINEQTIECDISATRYDVDDLKLINFVLECLQETVPFTKRVAMSSMALQRLSPEKFPKESVIPVLYKMLVDDSEEVRFNGCQICRIYFDSKLICSPLFYLREIWKICGNAALEEQRTLLQTLFINDFVKDYTRELENISHNYTFRHEPLNIYRDYYIEALLMKHCGCHKAIQVDAHILEHYKTLDRTKDLGFLRRSIKVLDILLGNWRIP